MQPPMRYPDPQAPVPDADEVAFAVHSLRWGHVTPHLLRVAIADWMRLKARYEPDDPPIDRPAPRDTPCVT